MNAQDLKQQIFSACNCPMGKRDFTQTEMDFIRFDESFKDELLFWFYSRISDGCWTEQTVNFMNTL